MSATVRELVDEAYDRRASTWRAALEAVNDWATTTCTDAPGLSGDRVTVSAGRIKDPTRTAEKLRRRLADSNDEIHEPVEVENQVIDIVGARIICQTAGIQSRLLEALSATTGSSAVRIAEVRDYAVRPKPSGYRARHLLVEVPFEREPSVLVEVQIRTLLQDSWSALVDEPAFKPGQALKSDEQRDRLARILSGLLAEADSVASYLVDDLEDNLGAPEPRPLDNEHAAAGSTGTSEELFVTIRELKHSYVLAADEFGRHGIIRMDSLGLTPGDNAGSRLPRPGETYLVRVEETATTRYFVPLSKQP